MFKAKGFRWKIPCKHKLVQEWHSNDLFPLQLFFYPAQYSSSLNLLPDESNWQFSTIMIKQGANLLNTQHTLIVSSRRITFAIFGLRQTLDFHLLLSALILKY